MIFCRVIDIGHYEITDDVDKEKELLVKMFRNKSS